MLLELILRLAVSLQEDTSLLLKASIKTLWFKKKNKQLEISHKVILLVPLECAASLLHIMRLVLWDQTNKFKFARMTQQIHWRDGHTQNKNHSVFEEPLMKNYTTQPISAISNNINLLKKDHEFVSILKFTLIHNASIVPILGPKTEFVWATNYSTLIPMELHILKKNLSESSQNCRRRRESKTVWKRNKKKEYEETYWPEVHWH